MSRSDVACREFEQKVNKTREKYENKMTKTNKKKKKIRTRERTLYLVSTEGVFGRHPTINFYKQTNSKKKKYKNITITNAATTTITTNY